MKKIDINNMMLFKLRDNRICVLMPRENGNCLYDMKSIESGHYGGAVDINSYLENLTDSNYSYNHYDIVAIKQFESMNEVLHHVLNNIEPKEWDWVREENKKKFQFTYNNLTFKDMKIETKEIKKVKIPICNLKRTSIRKY